MAAEWFCRYDSEHIVSVGLCWLREVLCAVLLGGDFWVRLLEVDIVKVFFKVVKGAFWFLSYS